MSERERILLVYDKHCPACDNYCQVVNITESVGELVLVNARDDHEVIKEVTDLGLDLDQGMVLKMGERLFYGADAIHALALISSRSGVFNRINYWVFKSKPVSKVLYPILKFLRNILLKLLRVRKVNNLGIDQNERF